MKYMKTVFFKLCSVLPLFLAVSTMALAQNESVTPASSFNIVKEVKPPILQQQGQITFVEPSGNRAIDANELCTLKLTVKNNGIGDGFGLRARIRTKTQTPGISFSDNVSLPVIKVGETYTVEFPIKADMNTVDGKVEFLVGIDEPNGLNLPEVPITVSTRAFVSPMVEFRGHLVRNGGNTLQKNFLYNMDVTVQNTGQGKAERVNVSIKLPDGVLQTAEENALTNGSLNAGETHTVRYSFIVPQAYTSEKLPIAVNISEKYRRFSKNGTINLTVNQGSASGGNTIDPVIDPTTVPVAVVDLGTDVDTDIPVAKQKDKDLYVLIIANGNYRYGDGVSTAIHDGEIVREYCVKTLGAMADHVIFVADADNITMSDRIESFVSVVERHRETGKFLLFYYGHGAPSPDREEADAYLIPVNLAQGSNMKRNAISRNDLMRRLQAAKPNQMVVCLEACFNGGTNEGGGKHVYTQQNTSAPMLEDDVDATSFSGNIVLLTASSGSQSAHAMPGGAHNVFTYQMLKKLQESGGNITWGELFGQVRIATQDYSQLKMKHTKAQTPTCVPSRTLGDNWKTWKVTGK